MAESLENKHEYFWNIKDNFLEQGFIKSCQDFYPNFHFKYDWSRYPQVRFYLMRLFLASNCKNNHNGRDAHLHTKIVTYIHDIEEFINGCIEFKLINDNNIDRILAMLSNPETGCRVLEFLPKELSGCYGNSAGNVIQMRPNFSFHPASPNLTPDELSRLYLFHELGHKVLGIYSNTKTIEDFTSTIDNVLESKGMEHPETNYIKYVGEGFGMIEECLTQELAEMLTYHISNKQRPKLTAREDMGIIHPTNLDFYGIFQKLTSDLGKTMRGCDNGYYPMNKILYNMILKAFYLNFDEDLIAEYNQGDANLYYDLFKTLRSMGFIKHQKYASFGIGDTLKIDTKSAYDAIEQITAKNIDNRDYPRDGFKPVNFEDYKFNQDSSSVRS